MPSSSVDATRLSSARARQLRPMLESLIARTDREARLGADPIRFPRRYADPQDAEIAAVFASGLAYGRVSAFTPVVEALLERADARGGPRRWIETFDENAARALDPLYYRWMRGPDFALLALTLRRTLEHHGSLGALFPAGAPLLAPLLDAAIEALRTHALASAPLLGIKADRYEDLPRGLRYLLPRPADGSACKRWCMLLRWMTRKPGPDPAGVDLGLWDLDASILVMPLDTHVHRISTFLGLTRRPDASWRTAVEITQSLARLDPGDPTRYDFALAHLGISGGCLGRYEEPVCSSCALQPLCTIGSPGPCPSI